MQTRSLGRTDLRLSEITLGTWGLAAQSYGKVQPERFTDTVRNAIGKGITSFDVAPTWGDSEATVARLAEEGGIEAAIITRGGARLVDGKLDQSFDTKSLIADCERSLKTLGREQIDLWLLHNPSEEELRKDAWRDAVDALEADGKIRCWGASVTAPEEARLALAAGAQAICVPHNLLSYDTVDDLAADLATSGAGLLARSPLMYGLLAGHWAPTRRFSDLDQRSRRWNRDALAVRVREVNELRFLVGERHRDLATAALRFVLSHSAVTTAIVGARTAYQVAAAVEAADGPPYLSEDDIMRIEKLRAS